MKWFGQTIEWENRYDEINQDYDKELVSLNKHLQLQGQEEAVLQSRLASLQDRISVEEHAARDEERQ
eukprot:12937350-Prorocentrum_lima.AAC.1